MKKKAVKTRQMTLDAAATVDVLKEGDRFSKHVQTIHKKVINRDVIAMLCGGGPAPGYLAVMYAAAKAALDNDWVVLGFKEGWRGVLNCEVIEITRNMIDDLEYWRCGTFLWTSRTKPKVVKNKDDDTVRGDQLATAASVLGSFGIKGLLGLGGEDTQSVGDKLSGIPYKVPYVGIPKTVDNDVCATERTFGADTMCNKIANEIRPLWADGAAIGYINVVQIMGRNCGRTTLQAGYAGGAKIILIPEFTMPLETICAKAMILYKKYHTALIAVAEELNYPDLKPLVEGQQKDSFGNEVLSKRTTQWAEVIAAEIESRTGLPTRVSLLGHQQRASDTSSLDTNMASLMGLAGFDAVAAGNIGKLVSWQGEKCVLVDIALAGGGKTRKVTQEEYDTYMRLLP